MNCSPQIVVGPSLLALLAYDANAQQFKVITSVESIVPNGLGRSRMISALEDKDYKEYLVLNPKKIMNVTNLKEQT